jgi:tripartite-type tricarboxylate transporter receptor subunit TctC
MEHTVIVENRRGAATAMAMDLVAKAAPDGHTLLMDYRQYSSIGVRRNLPYNIHDLTYLNRLKVNTALIVTVPNSGINSIQDLIAKIKANLG